MAEKAAVSCTGNMLVKLKEHNGHRVVLFQLSQASASSHERPGPSEMLWGAFNDSRSPPACSQLPVFTVYA